MPTNGRRTRIPPQDWSISSYYTITNTRLTPDAPEYWDDFNRRYGALRQQNTTQQQNNTTHFRHALDIYKNASTKPLYRGKLANYIDIIAGILAIPMLYTLFLIGMILQYSKMFIYDICKMFKRIFINRRSS